MALGEKTVLDLFTKKTDMAGEALQPGDAFLFAHKFTQLNLNTGETLPVIFMELQGGARRPLTPAQPHPGGVCWTGLYRVMSLGPGSTSPAASKSASQSGSVGISFLMTHRAADIPAVNTHPPPPLSPSLPPCLFLSTQPHLHALSLSWWIPPPPSIHSWDRRGENRESEREGKKMYIIRL